jgi:hypothetical protein
MTRPEESYRLWRVCVITKPRERGHSPRWAAGPEKKIYASCLLHDKLALYLDTIQQHRIIDCIFLFCEKW